jgi:dolichol-phosphate mannosyltransferase
MKGRIGLNKSYWDNRIDHMDYSVVIPIKNEETNIDDLIQELCPVMDGLHRPWELIYINDGSTDRSGEVLAQAAQKRGNIRVITFDRNYGQTSAFDAGFKAARGKMVITLDGDRQNNPADIPKLLAEMDGADLVCGWRKDRRDPINKKVISKLANAIRSRVCKDDMHDTGCSLKVYRTECLRKIALFDGMHRFLPALFKIHGYQVREVPVSHREREKGKSNYNFLNRSIRPLLDMFAVMWMRKRHLTYREKNGGRG